MFVIRPQFVRSIGFRFCLKTDIHLSTQTRSSYSEQFGRFYAIAIRMLH